MGDGVKFLRLENGLHQDYEQFDIVSKIVVQIQLMRLKLTVSSPVHIFF